MSVIQHICWLTCAWEMLLKVKYVDIRQEEPVKSVPTCLGLGLPWNVSSGWWNTIWNCGVLVSEGWQDGLQSPKVSRSFNGQRQGWKMNLGWASPWNVMHFSHTMLCIRAVFAVVMYLSHVGIVSKRLKLS